MEKNIKILIVEDDNSLCKLVGIELGRKNLKTNEAKNGSEALEWIKGNPNSLILLDYKLPDMDASELINRINEKKLKANIIIMTGHSDIKIAVEMMKLGVKEYLIKDVNFLDLLPAIVQRVIDDINSQLKLHEAEEAREDSENKYKMFVQNFQGIAFREDIHNNTVFFHGAVKKITGYDENDFLNKKPYWYDIVHPEDKKGIIKETNDKIRYLPGYSAERQYRIQRKDGQTRWIIEHIQNICDKSNKPLYIQGSIYDITDRKKVQDELFGEKEKLSAIIKCISEGMIVTDMNGKIRLMNSVAETITGWEINDALNKSLNEVYRIVSTEIKHNKKAVFENLITEKDKKYISNKVLLNKEGSEKLISDSASLLYDKDNNISGVVIVFKDITEKHKIDEELQKANKFDSLSTFASGISHDFNNLLAVIMGNLSLVLLNLNPEEENYQILTEAKEAIKQAKELSKQLVTFSKGRNLNLKTISITDLIKNTVNFLLRKSNIKLEFSSVDYMPMVKGDESQIIQVINNLIVNAMQAMPQGGKILISIDDARIESDNFLPLPEGDYVKIIIKDEGTGIPEKYLNKIFDPYFTTKEDGTGLGLSICYSIIKKHSGHITVESKINEGTAFSIYIPTVLE